MAACGRLTNDIFNDCDNPIVGGVKSTLTLINFEDLTPSSYTYNVTNEDVIESITLVASPSVRAYQFEGYKNSIEPQSEFVSGAYQTYWNHRITFRIFANTPEAKAQIEAMKNGKVVAIVENNDSGVDGNASFELFGKKQGLEITEASRNPNDADTQGAYVITLTSPETAKEPKLPATIFDTDYDTTLAMINSLLS